MDNVAMQDRVCEAENRKADSSPMMTSAMPDELLPPALVLVLIVSCSAGASVSEVGSSIVKWAVYHS